MKKSLFILAVLGITFTTCEKDDSQPNNSPTNNGGNNPTGGTGGTGEVDSRDTITLRSYNVNYESIEKIVLIKAEYDDGALEDEYKLTISIDDIEEMYEDNEFGVEYSLGSPLNIISFWWDAGYVFEDGSFEAIKLPESLHQIKYYVEIHFKETYTISENENFVFKMYNSEIGSQGMSYIIETDFVIGGGKYYNYDDNIITIHR